MYTSNPVFDKCLQINIYWWLIDEWMILALFILKDKIRTQKFVNLSISDYFY